MKVTSLYDMVLLSLDVKLTDADGAVTYAVTDVLQCSGILRLDTGAKGLQCYIFTSQMVKQ